MLPKKSARSYLVTFVAVMGLLAAPLLNSQAAPPSGPGFENITDSRGAVGPEDRWLNLGLAKYSELITIRTNDGPTAFRAAVDALEAEVVDTYPLASPDADTFPADALANKGAFIVHMVRNFMASEASFFNAVESYIAATPSGEATRATFQAAMQGAGASNLDLYFEQWLTSTARPYYDYFPIMDLSAFPRKDNSGIVSISPIIYNYQDRLNIHQGQNIDFLFTMPIEFQINVNREPTQRIRIDNSGRFSEVVVTSGQTIQPSFDAQIDPDNWILGDSIKSDRRTTSPFLQAVYPDRTDGIIIWQTGGSNSFIELGYHLYESPDGYTDWNLIADETVLSPTETMYRVTGLPYYQQRYYRVHSFITNSTPDKAIESRGSDVYGLRAASPDRPPITIIDGFDRWNELEYGFGRNHTLAVTHGRALNANGVPFQTFANEWFDDTDLPNMNGFGAIHWILGNELLFGNDPFERDRVKLFLEEGNNLFVSGDEFNWMLSRPTAPDFLRSFYRDYLKAEWVSREFFPTFQVFGRGIGALFSNDVYSYADEFAHYQYISHDVINAPTGTTNVGEPLVYSLPAGPNAAVEYFGPFGDSTLNGSVINLGFAFENIRGEENRIRFMERILGNRGFLPQPPAADQMRVY